MVKAILIGIAIITGLLYGIGAFIAWDWAWLAAVSPQLRFGFAGIWLGLCGFFTICVLETYL